MAPLAADALGSLQDLRRHALALGALSASLASETDEVADAYVSALAVGTPDCWTRFVVAAEAVVRHCQRLSAMLPLDAREQAARDFFAQITRENGDLLDATVYSAA